MTEWITVMKLKLNFLPSWSWRYTRTVLVICNIQSAEYMYIKSETGSQCHMIKINWGEWQESEMKYSTHSSKLLQYTHTKKWHDELGEITNRNMCLQGVSLNKQV